MTPDIVEKNGFIVVGIRSAWDLDPVLPGVLWTTSLAPRVDEITPAPGAENYSYVVFGRIHDDPGGYFEIVVGRVVDSLENIPTGMAGWEVPSGVYAVLEAEGLEAVYSAYRAVVDAWLPGSGYALGDGPCFAASPSPGAPGDPKAPWRVHVSIRNVDDAADLAIWT